MGQCCEQMALADWWVERLVMGLLEVGYHSVPDTELENHVGTALMMDLFREILETKHSLRGKDNLKTRK